MVLLVRLLNESTHIRAALRHQVNLLLLLRDIAIEVALHLRVQHSLWLVRHVAKLVLDCLQLFDLFNLLLLHLLHFQELLSFLENVLPHVHGLLEVLVPVFEDLLQGLLVEAYHLLLVFKHLGCLVLLLDHPFLLGCHLGRNTWG